MKILDSINLRLAFKGKPYTPVEIDEHESAERIWATIAECRREAQEAGQKLWDDGYWAGVHDRDPE